jgi:hypothetical protein
VFNLYTGIHWMVSWTGWHWEMHGLGVVVRFNFEYWCWGSHVIVLFSEVDWLVIAPALVLVHQLRASTIVRLA